MYQEFEKAIQPYGFTKPDETNIQNNTALTEVVNKIAIPENIRLIEKLFSNQNEAKLIAEQYGYTEIIKQKPITYKNTRKDNGYPPFLHFLRVNAPELMWQNPENSLQFLHIGKVFGRRRYLIGIMESSKGCYESHNLESISSVCIKIDNSIPIIYNTNYSIRRSRSLDYDAWRKHNKVVDHYRKKTSKTGTGVSL